MQDHLLPDRRLFLLGIAVLGLSGCVPRTPEPARQNGGAENLPDAAEREPLTGLPPGSERNDLFDAIAKRRSVRSFADTPVTAEDEALMLWAAGGVTDPGRGFRAAPSAGATYPLEIYTASAKGLHRYVPDRDDVEQVDPGDVRRGLAAAALGQGFVAAAPVVFIITGVKARTERRYGERAARYVYLEAGHAAQNILLVAVHLGLGAVVVGAFVDEGVRRVIGAGEDETPLYVIPVGHPAT